MLDNQVTINTPTKLIKVGPSSRPALVAGAIAGVVRESDSATVQAVGANAVNQAIKAMIVARRYLLEDDIEIFCVPFFVNFQAGKQEKIAIHLSIEVRHASQ
jgi:stage V sporulation protein S